MPKMGALAPPVSRGPGAACGGPREASTLKGKSGRHGSNGVFEVATGTDRKRARTARTPAVKFPLRVGAVDVGSNAVRFLAVEFDAPGRYRILEEARNPVRLGHGVFLTGRLAAPEMDAAVAVFRGYRQQLDALGISRYRAVATSAVRESENGPDFLERVREEAGLELTAISGPEETRLVHRAISSRVDLGTGTWLIVDLGGGSVEVSLADASGVLWSESHTMGAVRLLEELTGSAEDPGRFTRLLSEYVGTLRVPVPLERDNPSGYVATGGNVEALAQLALAPRDEDGVSRLPMRDLANLIQTMALMSFRQRVDRLGLREDRADVILPAAMIYERLGRLAGADHILVPHVGVKEGLVLDLADGLAQREGARAIQEEKVNEAARALGRKYRFDEAHGLHVSRLALSLFDQLAPVHGLGNGERRVLQAAAILHDIGSFVSFSRHHKHTLYLVANSNLPGFSAREVLMVANVARYHRRGEPKLQHETYAALERGERAAVLKLACLLRLADAMDREHRQTVRTVGARTARGALRLDLKGEGDMLLEGWALKRKADLFQKTFGLKVRVTVAGKGVL